MRVRRAPRVRGLVLGSLLGAMVLLGGCDSEEPPTSGPTPTPSSTTSSTRPSPPATPTPTPSYTSTIPAAARKKSARGAEAFARFYVEQSSRAWLAPDPSLLDGLSTTDCETCTTLEETARDLEQRSEKYSKPPIRWNSAQRLSGNGNRFVFEVKLTELPTSVVDQNGSEIESFPRQEITRAVSVVWQGEQWLVDGISE